MDKNYEGLKNMKQPDKATAFDILVRDYFDSIDDPQYDFHKKFVDTLDWCANWFSKDE